MTHNARTMLHFQVSSVDLEHLEKEFQTTKDGASKEQPSQTTLTKVTATAPAPKKKKNSLPKKQSKPVREFFTIV